MAVALQQFDDTALIRFPAWATALERADLSAALRAAHRDEIVRFLRFCKAQRVGATIRLIRHYLDHERRSPAAREALRWFFRAATRSRSPQPAQAPRPSKAEATVEPSGIQPPPLRREIPPTARHDLGGADWERDLIKAIRERSFLWRTRDEGVASPTTGGGRRTRRGRRVSRSTGETAVPPQANHGLHGSARISAASF